MKITQLGKFLRKIRIDCNQILMDMAIELNISVAQLSAIELGKRAVSDATKSKIIELYSSFCSGKEELERLIDMSQPSFKEDFEGIPEMRRELFISFARKYKEIPDEEAQEWLQTLNEMTMKR
ncbi:helix-turn-helix domain-containing protein [Serratia ureilytica]|uniref:helix-turn-helix domain-containing protein n=1 Tax=Serratia ureilytica TaxID=300181 RepID=UPI0038C6DF49